MLLKGGASEDGDGSWAGFQGVTDLGFWGFGV